MSDSSHSRDGPILVVVDKAPDGSDSVDDTSTTVTSAPYAADGVVDQAFTSAVALLRGSQANFVLCCSAMVISCVLSVVGFTMMTEEQPISRTLLVVSLMFLLSQTFTLAKVSRDRAVARRATDQILTMNIYVPTKAYLAQVVLFFLVAVGCSLYSLWQIEADALWYGFGVLDILWILVACFCLSKSVRDRHAAAVWSETTQTHAKQVQLRQILKDCTGTLEYRVLVYVACFAAIGFTLGFTWASWMDLLIERRGFLSIGVIFHASSCFHMAKLVRDRYDPIKSEELSKQIPFQAMVVGSFLLSWLIPLIGVCFMDLGREQLLFQLVGQLMTTNTTLNLAKVVRDQHEMKKLHEDLSRQGYVV